MVQQDIGAYVEGYPAQAPSVITAGAGIDGSEVDGLIVDRLALQNNYQSAALIIAGVTTLNTSETLTITANVQDDTASNMATAADYVYDPSGGTGVLAATIVKTGLVTAGPWSVKLNVNLAVAKRYIRSQITANLSRSGTDTAAFSATWVFGGGEEVPVT